MRKSIVKWVLILFVMVWVMVVVGILASEISHAEPKAIDVMHYRTATPDTAPRFYPKGMTAISAIHLENAAPKKRVVDVRPYRRSYR